MKRPRFSLTRTRQTPTRQRGGPLADGRLRRAAALAAVLVAAIAGGLIVLWSFTLERHLSAGTIVLSVSPLHHGSLDLYVPLVDWGVRFPGVNAPARLQVAVRSIDRDAALAIAHGGSAPIEALRGEARDAIASYLRLLALIAAGGSLVLGLLTVAAVRSLTRLRARWLVLPCVLVAIAWPLAIGLLLAPRGDLSDPSYFAHGSDIPVALEAAESIARTPGSIDASFEQQLVGLARLVIAPGSRPALANRPRLTIASDLHNNLLLVPTLRTAAGGGPVLFPGDLTDRGTPLEASALRSVVRTGHPFVFTAGNHDSDTLSQALARDGAIVLTQYGRLLPSGRYGARVAKVAGLTIAGYTSPNERLAADGYRDHGADVTAAQRQAFASWVAMLPAGVDVVMVHEPALVEAALDELRARARSHALLVVVGHTHIPAVDSADDVTEVNGGTLGAGGTGNLAEDQNASLAIVTYARTPFAPLAVDLVALNPSNGETTARRLRLGEGAVHVTGG